MTEHAFDINLGGTNYNWLLYDVGGAVRACFFASLLPCLVSRRARCLLIGPLLLCPQRGQASAPLSISRGRVAEVERVR